MIHPGIAAEIDAVERNVVTKLPAVLVPAKPATAISIERALKQIQALLIELAPAAENPINWSLIDKLDASHDDIEVMLAAIDRG